MRDKRRHARVPVDRRVRLIAPDGAVIHGSASNLSMSGIAVKTERPLAQGGALRVSLPLPGRDRIVSVEVHCKVIYVHYIAQDELFRIGMEFLELSREHAEVVEIFVMQRLGMAPL